MVHGKSIAALTMIIGLLLSPLATATPNSAPTAEEIAAAKAAWEKVSKLYGRVTYKMQQLGKQGNWLGAREMIREELAALDKDDANFRRAITQPLAWAESYLGNTVTALRIYPLSTRGLPTELPDDLTGQPLPTAIVNLVDNRQVVMINEAHHVPRHRANTASILAALHDAGFRYLAAETLSPTSNEANDRGYPVGSDGFYISDPVFANMLREALNLGFELVPYEARGMGGQARETRQAQNLADFLEAHPDARLLVHAGFAHIQESGKLGSATTMAQEFKRLTGIDPLTLHQTDSSWRGPAKEPYPAYQQAMQLAPGEDVANVAKGRETFVLLNTQGEAYSMNPEEYDVSVFTPPTELVNGRPSWLARFPGLRSVQIPVPADGPERPWVAEARRSSEPEDALALDRVEVSADSVPESITLWIPRGSVEVLWKDKTGKAFQVDMIGGMAPPPGKD